MSYRRQPVNEQPSDERSGRYAVDQQAPTETDLPPISDSTAERIVATVAVIGATLLALSFAAMIVRQWLLAQ